VPISEVAAALSRSGSSARPSLISRQAPRKPSRLSFPSRKRRLSLLSGCLAGEALPTGSGGQAGQLDSDHARQGLVHAASPLQPARTVLHQGVAAERDRIGPLRQYRSTTVPSKTWPIRILVPVSVIGPSAKWRHASLRSVQWGIAGWICSR
jgi:hypothetical protein